MHDRARGAARGAGRRRGPQGRQVVHAQAEQADGPGLQGRAAGDGGVPHEGSRAAHENFLQQAGAEGSRVGVLGRV